MKAAFTLRHLDWPYVERRGGIELLTHLRGAGPRADARREGIDRAFARFQAAESDERFDAEIGGLGLVVVQRALLAAEDLGGLLYAFRTGDPWTEIRATRIDRIDKAFEWAVRQPAEPLQDVFLLADREVLEADGFSEADIEILLGLRERAVRRWRMMLETAGSLWLSLHAVAKATQHGFPIWAGEFLFDGPGGGELIADLPTSPFGRCALVVTSTERPTAASIEVRSDRSPVRLDRDAVALYARSGKVAGRLYAEICEAHAESRMRGYAAAIPFALSHTLSSSDQARLRELSVAHDE